MAGGMGPGRLESGGAGRAATACQVRGLGLHIVCRRGFYACAYVCSVWTAAIYLHSRPIYIHTQLAVFPCRRRWKLRTHLGQPRMGALSTHTHYPLPCRASPRLTLPRSLACVSCVLRSIPSCCNSCQRPRSLLPTSRPPAVETPVTFLRFISPTHLLKLPPTCGLLL